MPRPARELTNEEFDDWCAATDRHAAAAEQADEAGGPRLSLVAPVDRAAPWPTDLILAPDEADAGLYTPAEPDTPGDQGVDPAATRALPAQPAAAAQPFDGVVLPDTRKRLAGWSADRQRVFLAALAETGSVHVAATEARLSARGAYRLRARSPEFAGAWDLAERLAVGRLSALAFDRAINGRVEQVFHDGQLIAEKRLPSDRMLMWLLARLDPRRFAAATDARRDGGPDPQATARDAFAGQLDGLRDVVG